MLPGISPMIAGTEVEAKRLEQELNELADTKIGLTRLSNRFDGHDFSSIKLDQVSRPRISRIPPRTRVLEGAPS